MTFWTENECKSRGTRWRFDWRSVLTEVERETGAGRGAGGGGNDTGSREVERLLLSSAKSTVNNAGNYQGRQKKKGGGMREEGREAERKRGGR